MPTHKILVIEDKSETAQNIHIYLNHNDFICDLN
jgi:hypothetical protein